MTEKEILQTLEKIGAVITHSHIVYTSGKHGSAYINKDAIYPHTELTSKLCKVLAQKFVHDEVDVVVAPAIGAVILSQWVAFHLSQLCGREVLGVYAEKIEGQDGFVIKRGYDKLIKGKKILIVEDVLTTGGSVKKVAQVATTLGANIIGVAALCNRGSITAKEVGDVSHLFSLVSVQLDAWDASQCPLCAQKIPINTEVGKSTSKGREFIK